MNNITYGPATAGDLPRIQTLLAECRLPTDGIERLTDNCITAKVDSNSRLDGFAALAPRCSRRPDVGGLVAAYDADVFRGGSEQPIRIP